MQVLDDLEAVLGPVPDGPDAVVYDCAAEIYSTFRMQLACLPRDLLSQVLGSHECDMWEVRAR